MHEIAQKEPSLLCRILKKNGEIFGGYEIKYYLCTQNYVINMSYTEKIVIKNPSKKLEEHMRWIGVQKYLWIERLCSDEVKPNKVIHV